MSLDNSDNESTSIEQASLNDAFIEETHDEKSSLEKFTSMVDAVVERIEENESTLAKMFDVSKEKLKIMKALYLDIVYLKSFYDTALEINDTFVGIVINFLSKLRDHLEEIYNFEPSECKEENMFRDMGRYLCTEIFYLINMISFESRKFITKFHEHNGVSILFDFLNNEKLVAKYVEFSENPEDVNFTLCDNLLRRNIGSLVCLAKDFGNFKSEWKNCKAVQSLINYLDKTKAIKDNSIYTCISIALVSDDDDINSIPEIFVCIQEIITMIGACSQSIATQENLERIEIEIDDDENDEEGIVVAETCSVAVGDTEWGLTYLLNALYHLTVNDTIKKDIYFKHEVNTHLRSIIYHGNFIEREYALNALWQLCFNKEISLDVYNDSELYNFIKDLESTTEFKNISRYASGIIWLLSKRIENKDTSYTDKNLVYNNLKSTVEKHILPCELSQHIMISYNRANRDLCLKIKSELEKFDFKVWIDVENISGSSLESMANAIENSFCVLVCMTEKYKQSTNCRAEGEYSFQQNRQIIPLIMQKDYKPEGWLGIILGSKTSINFTKNDYSKNIETLMKQIRIILRAEQQTKLTTLSPNEATLENVTNPLVKLFSSSVLSRFKMNVQILNWSERKVRNWLYEKNIHPVIAENLNSFDGKVLCELFIMKNESPDFFYKAITHGKTNQEIPLKDLALFSQELKSLFCEEN